MYYFEYGSKLTHNNEGVVARLFREDQLRAFLTVRGSLSHDLDLVEILQHNLYPVRLKQWNREEKNMNIPCGSFHHPQQATPDSLYSQ